MKIIEWVDPPIGIGARGKVKEYDELVEQLKTQPGQWALVAKSGSASIRGTLVKRGCEARTVAAKEHLRYDVYARWPS